ncbi:MAG: ABC transporter ATP-binding protein [Microbacteriaceae bacterium]
MPRISLGMGAALGAGIVALIIPQVIGALVDDSLAAGSINQVWFAFAIVLTLGVLEAAFIALRRWFVLKPGTAVEASMRNSLYAKLLDLPVAFHDRWPSGQLLSRSMGDLNRIRRWLSFGLVLLIINVITIVIGIAILMSINWILGLVFLIGAIPLWVSAFIFENKYGQLSRLSQDQAGDLATSVEESVHGIRVLKAFGRGKYAQKKFASLANDLVNTEIDKAKALGQIWFWIIAVPEVIMAVSLILGVWLATSGQMSSGELVSYFATAIVLRWPIESIGFLLSFTLETKNATDRFFDVMDSINTIEDPEHPLTIAEPRGELRFQDVHFRYQDAPASSPDLIDGINLTLEPGETMALVGVTGSGKTTITALASRLYDVSGGTVFLDGVDIRQLTRKDLRQHIAMAFEEAILFSDTVRNNVLLGRPDASEEELAEALSIAQAEFVYDLPEGLDTTIGEQGMSLSGGQRQRLALARAVAAKPSVLVLDDPLSALDVDTEAQVEQALREVLKTTTALIVAHRPSTVLLADRVALLEAGKITEVGKHSELLKSSEHYRYVISSLEQQLADEKNLRTGPIQVLMDTEGSDS